MWGKKQQKGAERQKCGDILQVWTELCGKVVRCKTVQENDKLLVPLYRKEHILEWLYIPVQGAP